MTWKPHEVHRVWTKDEKEKLSAWTAEGISRTEIARRMGRTVGGIYSMLERVEGRRRGAGLRTKRVSAGAPIMTDAKLAAQRARQDAEDAMSTTQRLCGDPPPGYSALDVAKITAERHAARHSALLPGQIIRPSGHGLRAMVITLPSMAYGGMGPPDPPPPEGQNGTSNLGASAISPNPLLFR